MTLRNCRLWLLSWLNSLRVRCLHMHLNLKFSELEHYRGERGRRGNKLPRGFQKVDSLAIAE